jgi:sulfur-carrier protein
LDTTFQLTVLFFAQIREAIGHDRETLDLTSETQTPENMTPRDVVALLVARGGGYAAAFADQSRLRCAIDLRHAGLDTPIGSAREVAFFPPVTGG